ncbi:hypothetical protein BDF19DRAFT_437085 [Syncephalis fuscata]|nr:hypothetical protein BDF19DRAFT_437085 [Syncephalis fuscata]
MVRFKHRYLLFEVLYGSTQNAAEPLSALQPTVESLSMRDWFNLLRQALEENFGDYGTASVLNGLQVKYFNPRTGLGIIRAPRNHFQLAWAALTFMQKIRGKPCSIRVIHVGGTIRSVQKHAIQYDRDQLLKVAERESIDQDNLIQLTTASETAIASIEY